MMIVNYFLLAEQRPSIIQNKLPHFCHITINQSVSPIQKLEFSGSVVTLKLMPHELWALDWLQMIILSLS